MYFFSDSIQIPIQNWTWRSCWCSCDFDYYIFPCNNFGYQCWFQLIHQSVDHLCLWFGSVSNIHRRFALSELFQPCHEALSTFFSLRTFVHSLRVDVQKWLSFRFDASFWFMKLIILSKIWTSDSFSRKPEAIFEIHSGPENRKKSIIGSILLNKLQWIAIF